MDKFKSNFAEILFKDLDEDEIHRYRKWARENYAIGSRIEPLWHPVIRRECEQMNRERGER